MRVDEIMIRKEGADEREADEKETDKEGANEW